MHNLKDTLSFYLRLLWSIFMFLMLTASTSIARSEYTHVHFFNNLADSVPNRLDIVSFKTVRSSSSSNFIHFSPPPLGWGSWNSFSNTVDSKIVKAQAKAVVSSGMRAAGYKYMLIDEGWWLGKRDEDGKITVNDKQWPAIKPGEKPGQMSNIARYIHELGLKPGIYTDAGPFGCSYPYPDIGPKRSNTGSLGYYDQDFLRFAREGFDYVKVDWCGGNSYNLDPGIQYSEIAHAIERAEALTGRQMFFSICNWGNQSPWTWGPGVGGITYDMWRTGGDITYPIVDVPAEAKRRVSLKNVIHNFDTGINPSAQHTGYYNDLDMMVLGMRGMSLKNDRVHMALWAISGAPMIVGADLTKLTKKEIAILTNKDVLSVDQDPLGLQGIKVAGDSTLQVWAKPLVKPGKRAVVMLNRTDKAATAGFNWKSIGLDSTANFKIKNVWSSNTMTSKRRQYQTKVPANDAVMLIVSGTEPKEKVYRPTILKKADNHKGKFQTCNGSQNIGWNAKNIQTFRNLEARTHSTYIKVRYKNTRGNAIVANLQTNRLDATKVQFPSTLHSQSEVGIIALEVELNGKRKKNTLKFSSPCIGSKLQIESVLVSNW